MPSGIEGFRVLARRSQNSLASQCSYAISIGEDLGRGIKSRKSSNVGATERETAHRRVERIRSGEVNRDGGRAGKPALTRTRPEGLRSEDPHQEHGGST